MKSLVLNTLSVLSLVAAVSSAHAAPFNSKACYAKAETNVDMKVCAYQTYESDNKRLNAVYKSIRAKLTADKSDDSAEMTKRLVDSERSWIAYRDAECSVQSASMLGGSGEGLVLQTCLDQLTVSKIKDLREMQEFLQ